MGPIGFVFGAAKKVYEGGKNVSEFLDESEEEKELKLLKQEKKAAIKDLLKEIREADPSGYIKIKRRYLIKDDFKLFCEQYAKNFFSNEKKIISINNTLPYDKIIKYEK